MAELGLWVQGVSKPLARLLNWAVLSLAFGLCAPLHAAGIQVTDDRGQMVTFASPPQRVVSLLPSLTETVCALGQCQRLIGVDRYSNWPAAVTALPKMGGGLDPQVEAIVAARPDVVLLAGSARLAERLEALGIKTLALEPKSHADVLRVLGTVGQLFALSPAVTQQVWQLIDAGVSAAAQSVPSQAKGVRVYFEVSSVPHGAGPTSFIGETLARLGAQNILPAKLGPFPQINPEFVVRANPGVIMVGDSSPGVLEQRPGWRAMPAVQNKKVCRFSTQEADVLVRPGPRMDEAARLMAQCLVDKLKDSK